MPTAHGFQHSKAGHNGVFISIFFFLRKTSRKKNAFAMEIIRTLEKDPAILRRIMSLLILLSGALFYVNEHTDP
jgi:hypothetical protein